RRRRWRGWSPRRRHRPAATAWPRPSTSWRRCAARRPPSSSACGPPWTWRTRAGGRPPTPTTATTPVPESRGPCGSGGRRRPHRRGGLRRRRRTPMANAAAAVAIAERAQLEAAEDAGPAAHDVVRHSLYEHATREVLLLHLAEAGDPDATRLAF